MLPSHGAGAWKLEDDEAAPSRAKGSVGAQPSPSVSPQLEKLLPLVMESRAPPSIMTGVAAPPHACDVVTGQRKDTMAHSGLPCAFPFGPASASLGSFNPLGPAPSLLRSPREGSPLLLLLSGARGLRGKGILALVYWSRRLERQKRRR